MASAWTGRYLTKVAETVQSWLLQDRFPSLSLATDASFKARTELEINHVNCGDVFAAGGIQIHPVLITDRRDDRKRLRDLHEQFAEHSQLVVSDLWLTTVVAGRRRIWSGVRGCSPMA